MIQTGLERLLLGAAPPPAGRWALLANQASVATDLRHGREHLQKTFPGRLACLFSPQHGFFAEKQDNMIESPHQRDPATGLPVFSLYGESRYPSEEMFQHFDTLLIDLCDVGTRVYTFLYTMAYCLEAAAKWGKKVVVLDRPNPLGGQMVEGNLLDDDCRSFVGLYPLPMRHGLTFGELALWLNKEGGIGCDLEIVAMSGWRRDMFFRDCGIPWIYPSPNMPRPETAMVYPGQVLWEGSNVSEGRGTTLPFELCGAPWFRGKAVLGKVSVTPLPGCFLRPVAFQPTSGKWAGAVCQGVQIHVLDHRVFMPYRTTLALLQAVMLAHPQEFAYKQPPYEYEYERLPMDLLIGRKTLREQLQTGAPIMELEASWREELRLFDKQRRNFFLYES
ncbi:MAG: DUF1343 domain-containing protein [Desulfobulbaceae bacterium]|jgi:uncharacterized protein YbbC (DUF1343 family)|nr:DUF1343 domain-containing protein [Desulfobulbaceae bacterium]